MMDKEEVARALNAIADRNDGRLTPDVVVREAKKKTSVLHKHFTWDIKKAAEERWLDQARELIRTVHVNVVTRQETFRVRAFVRDPEKPGYEQGYVALRVLRSDEEVARQALILEASRIATSLKRFRELATVLGLEGRVDEMNSILQTVVSSASLEGHA